LSNLRKLRDLKLLVMVVGLKVEMKLQEMKTSYEMEGVKSEWVLGLG